MFDERDEWRPPVSLDQEGLVGTMGTLVGLHEEKIFFQSLKPGEEAKEVGLAYFLFDHKLGEINDRMVLRAGFVRPDGVWGRLGIETGGGFGRAVVGYGRSMVGVCFDEGGLVQVDACLATPSSEYGRRRLVLTVDRDSNASHVLEQEVGGDWRRLRGAEVNLVDSTLMRAICVKYDSEQKTDSLVVYDGFKDLRADRLALGYQVGVFRKLRQDKLHLWTVRYGEKLEWLVACDQTWGGNDDLSAFYGGMASGNLAEEVAEMFCRWGDFRVTKMAGDGTKGKRG